MNKGILGNIAEKSTLDMDLQTNPSKLKELFKELSSLEEDLEIIEYADVPSVLYFKNMKNMPCVKFDRYLMLIESFSVQTLNDKEDPEIQTPIPKFIAYLVLVIRHKFEEELKNRVCFLETNIFPTNEKIVRQAQLLYYNSDSYEKVLKVSKYASCLLLFCALLELLQKFEHKLIQFSEETYLLGEAENIFKYCHPPDYVIVEQVTNFIQDKLIKPKNQYFSKLKKKEENPIITNLGTLIDSYYFTNNNTKLSEIQTQNRFNVLLYRDFRMTDGTMQRYIFRFILKNCIYIIRRYVCVISGRLRILRKESWEIANQTIVPSITNFAIYRMAKYLACTITEIKSSVDSIDARTNILKNLFSITTERIWYRQKKISEVLINTDPSFCHEGCVCGMG